MLHSMTIHVIGGVAIFTFNTITDLHVKTFLKLKFVKSTICMYFKTDR